MVVDFLKSKERRDWRIWLLALLSWSSSALAGSSMVFAQPTNSSSLLGGHVSEEDLPPEEPHAPASPAGEVSSPSAPPAANKTEETVTAPPVVKEPTASVPAAPVLPANTTLSPRELAALRFVEAGKGLLEQADLDRAREQFERAVALAPLQPYGYYFLGRVAFARHENKQAVAFLRKAELLFAPGDRAWLGETTSLQGAIYEDLRDYTQARAAYQRCLQVAPANLRALSALARLSEEEPPLSDTLPH
ncbi:MAG TPA: tetratricopeptide repeat protein [Candidatus Binatia bacterium]|jgi:tetratricopeptide (TPR) repeat protein|nr:tetratricopeptide repeat protein [Candidatus Binatia bacterium]